MDGRGEVPRARRTARASLRASCDSIGDGGNGISAARRRAVSCSCFLLSGEALMWQLALEAARGWEGGSGFCKTGVEDLAGRGLAVAVCVEGSGAGGGAVFCWAGGSVLRGYTQGWRVSQRQDGGGRGRGNGAWHAAHYGFKFKLRLLFAGSFIGAEYEDDDESDGDSEPPTPARVARRQMTRWVGKRAGGRP
ncbi:hypothetical protein B0H14DRAFT_2644325 [Mycena olivaceomarginata]|nr:hypothetical protein B0H14DRAFT_2644325 [Mycena olivaceomarginata]